MPSIRLPRVSIPGLLAGLSIFTVLAFGATGLLYAVYIQRSDVRIVRSVASAFPAARIGSRTVSYGDFLRSRDTLRIYLASEAAQESGLAQDMNPDVEKNALERLVREKALEEMAAEKNVVVPDEDVRASFAQLVLTTSSTIPNVAEYLEKTFHWTEEDFREHVMRPAILEERLAATLTSSTAEQPNVMDAYLRERLAKPDVKYYLKIEGQE
jgi:SurA-like protein